MGVTLAQLILDRDLLSYSISILLQLLVHFAQLGPTRSTATARMLPPQPHTLAADTLLPSVESDNFPVYLRLPLGRPRLSRGLPVENYARVRLEGPHLHDDCMCCDVEEHSLLWIVRV